MAFDVGALEIEIAAAIGKRVSIRLREGEAFRDLLGVLRDENSLVKKDGSVATFTLDAIAYFRVVPVFSRAIGSSAPRNCAARRLAAFSPMRPPS